MRKRLISAFILVAYIAILIKVMVFKDIPTIKIGQLMMNFGGADASHAPNFVPFTTIIPYLFGFKGLIIAGANLLGNIVLLVPIGFLVMLVYPYMNWKKSLILGVAAGLAIEVMQTVLHVGIFDIDDVILNALGVMVGFWAFIILAKWLRERKYIYILIVTILIFAAAAGALYAIYPHDQLVVNPGAGASQQDGTVSGSDDLCDGTGGTGEIISQGNHTITIKSKAGVVQTISLTNNTDIRNPAGAISESDLKIGDHVTVVIVDDSKNATAVLVCTASDAEMVRTYANDAFGVSFRYDSTQVGVLPRGADSIAVYALEMSPDQGQSITRFNKLANETLEQSVWRQILAGYSTSMCTVETITRLDGYVRAEIGYVTPRESPLGHEEECNASYDKTSGIRYFLYDPKHPDRFYFLDIGQYPLMATANSAWQDTISIR